MTPDKFEAQFLTTWRRWEGYVRWLKINRIPLCVLLLFVVSALLSFVFAASQIPSVCRNIDGTELCVVSKANIEKLLDEYDDTVHKLRKVRSDCKLLNES